MKKILSLGAAAAVLSLTAVAASAEIVATDNGTAPVAGGEYTVDIVVQGEFPLVASGNDMLAATQFTVEASDNLTLASYTATNVGTAMFNQDRMAFTYANFEAPADGTVLLSLVFTVDAAAEEEVSVKIVPDAGFEAGVDVDAITSVVVDVTDEPISDEPVPTETPEPTVETEPAISVDTPSTETPDDDNPSTGVALAVIPALVAGAAAVVAAKKRK